MEDSCEIEKGEATINLCSFEFVSNINNITESKTIFYEDKSNGFI